MRAMTPNHNSKPPISFRGVKDRYRFPSTIIVDYILAGHEVQTSPTDFIGIYPRGWNDLIQFVGFECAKYMPCAEETLDRCLEITCKPPVFNVKFDTEYQFVYVHHTNKVLGKSKFFRFVEEFVDEVDDWKESEAPDWTGTNDSNWQDEKACATPGQNISIGDANIEMGPLELEYNRVFFQNSKCSNSVDKSDAAHGGLNGASNSCLMPPLVQSFQTLSKRRALVKTRDGGYDIVAHNGYLSPTGACFQFLRASPNSPGGDNGMNRKFFTRDQSVNTVQSVNTNGCESNHSSNFQMVPLSSGHDLRSGAVPKRCSKCQAPSDYQLRQKLVEHELDQAYDQIRDLNNILDKVKRDLELSQAAQAKLRAVNGIAKKDREEAIILANSLLMAIFGQGKSKGDMNQLSNPHALPSWLDEVCYGEHKFLFPSEPPIRGQSRAVTKQFTLLKAIIGHQEEKIGKLNLELISYRSTKEAMERNRPPFPREHRARKKWKSRYLWERNENSEKQKLDVDVTSKISLEPIDLKEDETIGEGTNSSLETVECHEVRDGPLIVQPKFYQLDAMLASSCEVVVVDPSCEKETEISPKEANNNTFVTKNLNPNVDGNDVTLQDSAANADNCI